MAKSIEDAHDKLTRKVIDWQGVTGTAIGTQSGKACIKVYVNRAGRELSAKLPKSIGGFRVVVEETGSFRPL